MKSPFYLTTPLYYVNGKPHIGHAYTTVVADALARYHRIKGDEVFFLTGTDEHGQKIEREAETRGVATIDMVDELVVEFKNLWQKMNISYDRFIRTTEKEHVATVVKLVERIKANGYIYPGEYEGWYCTPCETYWTEEQLDKNNLCPDCSRETEKLKEQSYFFKLSAFEQPLLDLIEQNPDFVRPRTRLNEVTSFIKMGLKDLSISRTSFHWGIPLPFEEGYIIYVWFDALINYISAVDFLNEGEKYANFWPANVHLVGKDIIKFHAVIWPAMLMAAGLEPPRQIFAHGWWTVGGGKMSKSKGNVIDPIQVIDEYGLDIFRYFILREVPFGLDGVFSREALILRTNADLANDLGNLLHRTSSMLKKYFELRLEPVISEHPDDAEFIAMATGLAEKVDSKMQQLEFHYALTEIFEVVKMGNKYIDTMAPWTLYKNGETRRLQEVMYNIFESLRIVSFFLYPFIPDTATELQRRLGVDTPIEEQAIAEASSWGGLNTPRTIILEQPLFPRLEV